MPTAEPLAISPPGQLPGPIPVPVDHVTMPVVDTEGQIILPPASVAPLWAQVDILIDGAGHKAAAVTSGDFNPYVNLVSSLYQIVLEAYAAGIEDSPAYLVSGSTAAAQLGINGSRIRVLAAQMEVGSKLRVGSQDVWLFTPGDMLKLETRPDRRGRPAKGGTNDSGA